MQNNNLIVPLEYFLKLKRDTKSFFMISRQSRKKSYTCTNVYVRYESSVHFFFFFLGKGLL